MFAESIVVIIIIIINFSLYCNYTVHFLQNGPAAAAPGDQSMSNEGPGDL